MRLRSAVLLLTVLGPAASGRGEESVEVRALAMLLQVRANLEESVAGGDLATVHYQDMFLYSALGQLYKLAATPERAALSPALRTLSRAVADLHAAADTFDAAATRARLPPTIAAFDEAFAFFDAPTRGAAQALADRFTCPMHPEVVGRRQEACAKCGMPLEVRARLLPFGVPEGTLPPRTITAEVRLEEPLRPGQENRGVLKLTSMGIDPVKLADLREVHTRKIHLLIVDESLGDYHHEHPVESAVPGEYSFSFTPRRLGLYRAWADVQPLLTGLQEYASADVAVAGATPMAVEKTVNRVGEAEGLRFELTLAEVKAGEPVDARVRVTGAGGKPFTALEPIMGAFAHLVAFREDRRDLLHLHPVESRRLAPDDRGGPELAFRVFAPTPGYYRLFLQVQVGGRSRFVPFGVEVHPPSS
ncbi:MAG TPA: heavy metal-binding domain-containing protein [Vicinamibacteria bacterium]